MAYAMTGNAKGRLVACGARHHGAGCAGAMGSFRESGVVLAIIFIAFVNPLLPNNLNPLTSLENKGVQVAPPTEGRGIRRTIPPVYRARCTGQLFRMSLIVLTCFKAACLVNG